MPEPTPPIVETRASWTIACVALAVMSMAFGAPWILSVALKTIAEEAGGSRSIPALAASLAWLGSGIGGIAMGAVANKFGVRLTVISGSLMIATGLFVATLGPPWPLWIGYGLFVGLIGLGAINAPLYIYISHWFDRRRGSALALISSGGYLAGAVWPPIFERFIAFTDWRQTMMWYAALVIAVNVPLAAIFFRPPPEAPKPAAAVNGGAGKPRVLGLPPNLVFVLTCFAAVSCCVAMSMPQQHLIAFCSDNGMSLAVGAAMLSVLLGCAVLSRQIWGVVSDNIGGLRTIFAGSAWQALAMAAFVVTQNEAGLFTVSALFGLGFSGIIPAYALAVRELYPVREAYWRIPTVLMCTGIGMALGGWLAGAMYDQLGYYQPAFATGVGFNVLNFAIIGFLVWRQSRHRLRTRNT